MEFNKKYFAKLAKGWSDFNYHINTKLVLVEDDNGDEWAISPLLAYRMNTSDTFIGESNVVAMWKKFRIFYSHFEVEEDSIIFDAPAKIAEADVVNSCNNGYVQLAVRVYRKGNLYTEAYKAIKDIQQKVILSEDAFQNELLTVVRRFWHNHRTTVLDCLGDESIRQLVHHLPAMFCEDTFADVVDEKQALTGVGCPDKLQMDYDVIRDAFKDRIMEALN